MRSATFALLAFTTLTATAIGQGFDPIQQLTMPGGRVRHAYDPFAAPQLSALPGVRGMANSAGPVKSPGIDWQSVTTATVGAHGAIATGVGARGAVTVHEPQVLRTSDGSEFVAGELIVKLKDGVTVNSPGAARGVSTKNPELDAILQRAGNAQFEPIFKNTKRPATRARSAATGRQEPDLTRWYKLSGIDASTRMTSLTEELESNPDVAWYEPNFIRRPAVNDLPTSVTDPKMADQWHLQATQVPEAWAYLKSKGLNPGGSPDVVVAVIDTGVDYNHPDLTANMWANSGEIPGNGIDDDFNGYIDDVHGINAVANSGNPIDDHGHGTHVAGIIAAQAGNNEGGVGVAYNSRVMGIKSAQYSGVLTVSDIVEGINYAVAHGAAVINMSYGGYSRSQLEEDTLTFASSHAVLVASAGNDSKPTQGSECVVGQNMYPAAYGTVVGVMAEDQNGDLAQFSNYDCTAGDGADYDLMAPGVDIVSLLPGNQYASWDGTSSAAPIVAGVAALLRSEYHDTVKYNASFLTGQIVATAVGRLKAADALMLQPRPQLSYLEHWIFDDPSVDPNNDGDGIVDAGETVDFGIVLKNNWGAAKDVIVKIEAFEEEMQTPDPYSNIIIGTNSYGNIASFSAKDNGLVIDDGGLLSEIQQPFRMKIDQNTPYNHLVKISVTITGYNDLVDFDKEQYASNYQFSILIQKTRQVPSIIDKTTTLTADFEWHVLAGTQIKSAGKLVVEPGVLVTFGPDTFDSSAPYFLKLDEYATISVTGTEEYPVNFVVTNPDNLTRNLIVRESNTTVALSNARINYSVDADDAQRCYFYGPHTGAPAFHGRYQKCIFDQMGVLISGDTTSLSLSLFNRPAGQGVHLNGIGNYPNWKWIQSFRDNVVLHHEDFPFTVFSSMNTSYDFLIKYGHLTGDVSGNAFLPYLGKNSPSNIAVIRNINPGISRVDGAAEFLNSNYCGPLSANYINDLVMDGHDYSHVALQDEPSTSTYPFVYEVKIATESTTASTQVGAEFTTFTVKYNRDMDSIVQPVVTFGPAAPYNAFSVTALGGANGGWVNPRTWQGNFSFTPVNGNGQQYMRIIGGRAADDHWMVCGDDQGRHGFEVVTAAIQALQLQATGGAGKVDLAWTQDDFDLLAGYNLYRSNTPTGTYQRVNNTVIPPQTSAYSDTTVAPGQTFSYKFTIVKTDFTESNPSAIASATALDNVPPVVNHNPVVTSPPNQSRTIQATVTDNISVQAVTLFHRKDSSEAWQVRNMIKNTTNNSWSVNLAGSVMAQPGIYYYISATDGVNTSSAGTETGPFFIAIGESSTISAWPWYN